MSSQFRSRFLCSFVFTIKCFEGGRVADTICSVYYRNMLQSWRGRGSRAIVTYAKASALVIYRGTLVEHHEMASGEKVPLFVS